MGDAGNDLIWGGDGDDSINGGNDLDIVMQESDEDQILTNSQLTGQGIDTLVDIERGRIQGGVGDNLIDASQFPGTVALFGGPGNDRLVGGSAIDRLVGQDGNDTIEGLSLIHI